MYVNYILIKRIVLSYNIWSDSGNQFWSGNPKFIFNEGTISDNDGWEERILTITDQSLNNISLVNQQVWKLECHLWSVIVQVWSQQSWNPSSCFASGDFSWLQLGPSSLSWSKISLPITQKLSLFWRCKCYKWRYSLFFLQSLFSTKTI